jgi:hypothetical protein
VVEVDCLIVTVEPTYPCVTPMDLLSFKESFFIPRVKGFDVAVVGKGFTKLCMSDLLIIGIVFPTSVRWDLIDNPSGSQSKANMLAFLICSKGSSSKSRSG